MTTASEVNPAEVVRNAVGALIQRAAKEPGIDAMHLTQAACNAANALCSLQNAEDRKS